MAELLLIRHGQTVWNKEGRYTGQTDIPLSELGLAQAQELVDALSDAAPIAVYSSDLQRAFLTAQPLAERFGLEIAVDPRLREIHQGAWEGLLFDDIKSKFAEEFAAQRRSPANVSAPGGETILAVRARVFEALEEILSRHRGTPGAIAIVSHGFVIALIRLYFSAKPLEEVWDLIPHNVELIRIETEHFL